MKIEFADPAIGELYENYNPDNPKDKFDRLVRKRSGNERNAKEVMSSLDILKNAKNPSEILPMYNYHLLKYDKSGYAAIDVLSRGKGKKGGRGKWRIEFRPVSNCDDINKQDSVEKIIIKEIIIDYHNDRGKK